MVDNVESASGSGGATFATDDIGGIHYPRSKVVWGPDGTANDTDTASGKALPVQLRSSTGTEISPALESGGNIAAAATSLAILDDWDETDRAKVNIIAGQAGITAGAGAVGASTPRVTLASDDPAVASLAILDNIVSGSEAQVDIVAALPAGTNNIGDVDILSIAAGDNNIGNVDLASAIPAGTNLIGRISASPETSTVYNGTTALTPKFAVIDNATSGDNTLVAAVTGKKIRVHQLALIGSAAVTVRFESGASGTALTGQMQFAANGGFVLPFSPMGWFETASDALLNMELNGATSVDGVLGYTEV